MLAAALLANTDGYYRVGVFVSRSLISWIIIGLIADGLRNHRTRTRLRLLREHSSRHDGAVLGGWIFSSSASTAALRDGSGHGGAS